MTPEEMKKAAALEALKLVRDGMVLGIGTGSTVNFFIDALKDLIAQGVRIRGVSTSIESSERARTAGVSVEEDYTGTIDLDVDGADEMDASGNLVKGGGGALLREKIIAYNSKNVCIIADESKFKTNGIGTFRIPVEVLPYLSQMTRNQVERLGGICIFRENGKYRTDNGNMVMDCDFGIIKNPTEMESKIKMIPGVMEVGLFCGLATLAVVAGQNGIRTINFKNFSP
ncbi:MAG: ribose-5-phosphate isomerase RpiA [Thermoplasmataceae archaeon]